MRNASNVINSCRLFGIRGILPLPAKLIEPERRFGIDAVFPVVLAAIGILILCALSVATANESSWLLINSGWRWWWWWWWWSVEATETRTHRAPRSVEIHFVLVGESSLHCVLIRASITVVTVETRSVDTVHRVTHHWVAEPASHHWVAEPASHHWVAKHGRRSVDICLQGTHGRWDYSRARIEEVVGSTADGSTTDGTMSQSTGTAVNGQSKIKGTAEVTTKIHAAFSGIFTRRYLRSHEVVDAAGTSGTSHTTTTFATTGVVVCSVVPLRIIRAISVPFGENARMVTESVTTAHTSTPCVNFVSLSKPRARVVLVIRLVLVPANAGLAIIIAIAPTVEAADTSVDIGPAILDALMVGRALVVTVIWVDSVVRRAFHRPTRCNLGGETTVRASSVEVDLFGEVRWNISIFDIFFTSSNTIVGVSANVSFIITTEEMLESTY